MCANNSAPPAYKDLRLVIIGDTISQYPGSAAGGDQEPRGKRGALPGLRPFDTLRCFYESAAAFVFPSRYEGFGLPPLEAMACGTPVVTSNASSLPEVVGDAAMQVNPENVFDIARGIKEVLSDEELRAALIRRGREQAARFSWSARRGRCWRSIRKRRDASQDAPCCSRPGTGSQLDCGTMRVGSGVARMARFADGERRPSALLTERERDNPNIS